MGINSRIAKKKPFINQIKIKRKNLMKTFKGIALNKIKTHTVFTDEMTIQIGKQVRISRSWRERHEKFIPECLSPIYKTSHSINVYACSN